MSDESKEDPPATDKETRGAEFDENEINHLKNVIVK